MSLGAVGQPGRPMRTLSARQRSERYRIGRSSPSTWKAPRARAGSIPESLAASAMERLSARDGNPKAPGIHGQAPPARMSRFGSFSLSSR